MFLVFVSANSELEVAARGVCALFAVVLAKSFAAYATVYAVRTASAKVYASRASQYSSYAVLYKPNPVYTPCSLVELALHCSQFVYISDALLLEAVILPLTLQVRSAVLLSAPVDVGTKVWANLHTKVPLVPSHS